MTPPENPLPTAVAQPRRDPDPDGLHVSRLRRRLPLITILLCQAMVAGLALLLYFVTRPAFAEAYDDSPMRIPRHAMLALSSWYLPALAVIGPACDLLALAFRKRSARNFLMGFGLVVQALGLAVAIDGIFVPLFQAAPMP